MVGLLTREKTKADAPVLATEPNEEDAKASVAEHQATKVGAMQEGGRETQATRTALPAGGVMRSGWKPPAVAAWETEAQAREQRLAELVARRDAIRKLIVPPTGAEGREAYEADASRLARATIAEGGAS